MRTCFNLAVIALGLAMGCDGGESGTAPADAAGAGANNNERSSSSPFSETCLYVGSPARQVRSWGTNGAELEGSQLGDGAAPTASLSKKLPARLLVPDSQFELGDAHLIRDSEDSIATSLVASVRFLGEGMACFIEAVDIAWLAADGTIVREPGGPEREESFVEGSVGLTGPVATDTCLAKGETGYLVDLRLFRDGSLFQRVAAVELRLDPSWTSGEASPARVHATSYVRCGSSRELEVAFESRGSEGAIFDHDLLGKYLLLGDMGEPLTWGFLNTRRGLGLYPPGKVTVGGDRSFFGGSSRRMLVTSDFTPVSLDTRRSIRSGAGSRASQRAILRLAERRQEVESRLRARWRARAGWGPE